MIKTKKIFKRNGIEVCVARGSIYTLEKIGAEIDGIEVEEKVISLNWGEKYRKSEGETIVCKKPSLSIERKNILKAGDFFKITREDIVYIVRHLSVLIDCCRVKKISFIDSTSGGIEDAIEDAEDAEFMEKETRNIINFLWGSSE